MVQGQVFRGPKIVMGMTGVLLASYAFSLTFCPPTNSAPASVCIIMSAYNSRTSRKRQRGGTSGVPTKRCPYCNEMQPVARFRNHTYQCASRVEQQRLPSPGVFTTESQSEIPLYSALKAASRPNNTEAMGREMARNMETDEVSVAPFQAHPSVFNVDNLGFVVPEDGRDNPLLIVPQNTVTSVFTSEWSKESEEQSSEDEGEDQVGCKQGETPAEVVNTPHGPDIIPAEDLFLGDLRSQYDAVEGGDEIEEIPAWGWRRPTTEEGLDPCLVNLLNSPKGRYVGCCFRYPVAVAKKNRTASRLHAEEVSLLRMIQYCDQNTGGNRGFVDQFLDLVAEETTGPRKFDVARLKGFRRDTVCRKVTALYGKGCEPRVVQITVSTEELNVVAVEESNPDRTGPSVPRPIQNRERLMISCIVFDIEAQMKDLLDDEVIFGNWNNLVVNPENPFAPYKNESSYIDEALDGTWHVESLQRLKSQQNNPFVEGIDFKLDVMLYVDKTGTAGNQRYPLEPFLFTFPVIKRAIRNLPEAWRAGGYIPDNDTKSAAERRYINSRNRGAGAQSYHLCLEQMLAGFRAWQEKGGFIHWVRIGDYKKKMRVRGDIMCFISDGKAADMNTSRTPSTHPERRISRSCRTLQKNADNVLEPCEWVRLDDDLRRNFLTAGMSTKAIQEDPLHQTEDGKPSKEAAKKIVEAAKVELNRQSFVPATNAFVGKGIRFGDDPRSIWGACPIDLMHAFQSGIVKYLVKMVVDKLSTKNQTAVDRLVHKLFHNLRSREKNDYPRLTFSKGFTKLTMITSDEWVGKLFVLLLVLKTDEGRFLFRSTFREEDLELPKALVSSTVRRGRRQFGDDLDSIHQQVKELNREASLLDDLRRGSKEDAELSALGVPADEEEERKQLKKRKHASVNNEEDDIEEMLRPCSANDFTQLAEALLCFHAWYKLGIVRRTESGKADKDMIHASVQKMLAMVRYYTPRKRGNGWKIQKFHDILHLAADIERFGCPSNYDAGPQESGLKKWAKIPAQTSQKRGHDVFLRQVAARVYERQCITKALRAHGIEGSADAALEKACRKVSPTHKDPNDNGAPRLGGTTYRIYGKHREEISTTATRTAFAPSVRTTTDKRTKSLFVVSPVVENFLRWSPVYDSSVKAAVDSGGGDPYWELKTECSMVLSDSEERITLRCHPNFQNEGPWYDWALVRFDCSNCFFHKKSLGNEKLYRAFKRNRKDVQDRYDPMEHVPQNPDDCVPCKILAFGANEHGTPMALVHGCSFRTTNSHVSSDTVLVEFWHLEYQNLVAKERVSPDKPREKSTTYQAPYLCWVELSSIVAPCFVVEEEPGLHEVLPYAKVGGRKTSQPRNRVMLLRPHALWAQEFTN